MCLQASEPHTVKSKKKNLLKQLIIKTLPKDIGIGANPNRIKPHEVASIN